MRLEKTYSRLMHNMDQKEKERYKNDVKQYAKWANKNGLKRASDEEIRASLKDYVNYRLNVEKLKPESVRHNITGLLCALKISRMVYDPEKGHDVRIIESDIPVVSKTIPTKGRKETSARSRTVENSRIIHFANAVGIRKEEYAHLKGKDLVELDGRLYVHVAKGKGGKEQYQYILPGDEQIVRETFKGIEKEAYVFTKKEIKACGHANLHECRRLHAQKAYDYFLKELQDPTKYEQMCSLLKARWKDNPKKNWDRDIEPLLNKRYYARGDIKNALKSAGRPIAFDRLTLLAVSNLELAHYRCDVTVKNYMM